MFLCVGVGLVLFGAVLPMFLLYFLVFRSRNCLEKILLMSGLVFWGCLLFSFGCFADVAAFSLFFFSFSFFRETDQVVTGHTPTRTSCFSSFSCLCPRRIRFVLPFWPCVLSFWCFGGVPFWAPGVFGILLVLL